jgi:hypothetical protein
MVGLSDAMDALSRVLWPDAELKGVDIDYDHLRLTVRESTGICKRVVCEGYLGYELAGFWDEVLIAHAELDVDGAFLARCVSGINQRLGAQHSPSGSPVRNLGYPMQLVITLDDGCKLNVAMKGLQVEEVSA